MPWRAASKGMCGCSRACPEPHAPPGRWPAAASEIRPGSLSFIVRALPVPSDRVAESAAARVPDAIDRPTVFFSAMPERFSTLIADFAAVTLWYRLLAVAVALALALSLIHI